MEAFKPELNLFGPPEVQSSIVKSNTIDVLPTTLNLNSGPLEFEINGNEDYIDLNDTMLYVNA